MSDATNDQVISFASRNMGERVASGQCFDLADRALRAASARSAADFGTVTPDADYVWGTSVALADVRAGDIIQFRDYTYRLTNDDGSWEENERPHHTAIVASVGSNGVIDVYEQNVNGSMRVQRNRLYFANSAGGGRNVRVSGTFWFYRPQAR